MEVTNASLRLRNTPPASLTCTTTSWEMSMGTPSCPGPATGGRRRLGPNTVARFIRDILLASSFSDTLRRNRDVLNVNSSTWGVGYAAGPLQVVQEVEEGVPVGLGTGLEDGQHGREAGLDVLEVCGGQRRLKVRGSRL